MNDKLLLKVIIQLLSGLILNLFLNLFFMKDPGRELTPWKDREPLRPQDARVSDVFFTSLVRSTGLTAEIAKFPADMPLGDALGELGYELLPVRLGVDAALWGDEDEGFTQCGDYFLMQGRFCGQFHVTDISDLNSIRYADEEWFVTEDCYGVWATYYMAFNGGWMAFVREKQKATE